MTEEILDNMNQTELAQPGLQETKGKRINFQLVWRAHPYTILTLKSEEDGLNIDMLSFTVDHFSRKSPSI